MNQIVSLLSRWLIKHNAIAPSDRELYEYALYSFLLSLTPLIIFLVISGVIGMFWEGMLIVFPFMVLRKFAGGFHAKHAFVAVINIIIHSPIDSENRRLSETEKEQYSWMTRFLVIVIMMFYVILIIVRLRYYASCVAISLCLSALLQLPCVLRLKWQKD